MGTDDGEINKFQLPFKPIKKAPQFNALLNFFAMEYSYN